MAIQITPTPTTSSELTDLAAGMSTFLGTPSSANLIAAMTDETGTGACVFATSPALVTPALGTPASGVLTSCTGTADGLTAGDVTRNHAVYAGASPPTVDVGHFTIQVASVNMKAAGTTTVFTVPTGRKFVCTGAFFIVTAVTTPGAGTQTFKIVESGAGAVMTAATVSGSGTPAVGTYYGQFALPGSGPFTACAAGNIVQVTTATSQAGSTAVTGTCFVQGFYSA